MFVRVIHNNMFEHFTANNLILPTQSGLNLVLFCKNLLLSRTNESFQSFDNSFEVRDIFTDASKKFNKVTNSGLIFNLSQYGRSGNLIKLFQNCRLQVAHNGQGSCPSWCPSSMYSSSKFLLDIYQRSIRCFILKS